MQGRVSDAERNARRVSHSTDPDYDYWKVEYDFACVVFAEYQDAPDFCAGRFFDSDGKPVKAVRA